MDINEQRISLHPQLLHNLFAHKSKTRAVFNDVLSLHEINHIAIAYISASNTLTTLSSTPSLEYNLFNSPLWQFDTTFSPSWFNQCAQASWQSLYSLDRYDELYYIKQTKPRYPLGLSMAAKMGSAHVIYSIASTIDSEYTRQLFQTHVDELYKVGQYCTMHLLPLLTDFDVASSTVLHPQLIGAL